MAALQDRLAFRHKIKMAWKNYSKNKYKNKKIVIDGIEFQSKKEARRWQELKLLEQAGEIYDLQRQVKFTLIPAQREPDIKGVRGGRIKGKLLERECCYYADFVYFMKDDVTPVVEDTKGVRTPEYVIKRKLMLYNYDIQVKEI